MAGPELAITSLVQHAASLLLPGSVHEARPAVERVLATGYRRRPFVELCDRSGLRVPKG